MNDEQCQLISHSFMSENKLITPLFHGRQRSNREVNRQQRRTYIITDDCRMRNNR